MLLRLFKSVAKSALDNLPKALLDNLPFGNAAYDFAKDMVKYWKAEAPRKEDRRAELQQVAVAAPAHVLQQAKDAVAVVAADQPEALQLALVSYLTHLPGTIRRSLSRPADRTGTTVPLSLALDKPEDVMPFLPARRPRFHPGDRPVGVGDWHLVELLGVGGFGEVWKATNPHRPGLAPVALKFCLDEKALDALKNETDLLDRVESEGTHEGIVRLKHTYLSADPPCLEYEYIAGGDLGSLIAEMHAAASPALFHEVTKLMHELCGIVAFAHSRNPPIVHRDLKPANILVQPRADGTSSLRVADFGIGGVAVASALTQTRRGTTPLESMPTKLRGAYTPLYASEQQMNAEKPHPRDDVYSLGVIWYQMLTGDLSKGRPSNKAAERLGAKGLAPELVKLVLECVEDEREDRPGDAGVVEARIAPFVKRLSTPPPLIVPSLDDLVGWSDKLLRKAGEIITVSLPGSITMSFAWCPAGTFLMGSRPNEEGREGYQGADETQHRVRLTKGFWTSVNQVTRGQFARFVKASGYKTEVERGGDHFWNGMKFLMDPTENWFTPGFDQTDEHPVVSISWNDVSAFLKWLTGLDEIGRRYRLPTEAEWEYACRAGTTTPFHFGDTISPDQANYNGNFTYGKGDKGSYRKQTTHVGFFPANAWGLCHMHGNVWEWCADWYGPYPKEDIKDPTGTDSGVARVLRGGSWGSEPRFCRAAYRLRYAPSLRPIFVGFRLVLCLD